MTDATGRHVPQPPEWRCLVCAIEWPCPSGQHELRELYPDDRIGLAVYLGAHQLEATADLNDRRGAGLMARFVSWSRQPVR